MKKLLIILLFFACHASAQMMVSKTDQFTGKLVKGTTITFGPRLALAGSPPSAVSMTLIFNDENSIKYVTIIWRNNIAVFGNFRHQDLNNNSLQFKLDGNTEFNVPVNNISVGTEAGHATITAEAVITDEQLSNFITHKIATIGLIGKDGTGGEFAGISDSNKDEVEKMAAFMLGMKSMYDPAKTNEP